MISTSKLFVFFLLAIISGGIKASESIYPMQEADVDISDLESVRKGARYYVEYCVGCHSIRHLRYSRISSDLKVDEQSMKGIMVEGGKLHDSLLSSLDGEDAIRWFGVSPPDLSLIARARGADWLFNYLKGFYVDASRSGGVNNVVYKDVGMPNVFWELQGLQKPVLSKTEGGGEAITSLIRESQGKMSPQEFDQVLNDLISFLVYAAEPARYERIVIGKYVIFGLVVLIFVFYRLKKEYWKDIEP